MEASSESLNQRVSRCLLWEKVKEGHVHLITAEDIEELFHAFEVYDPDLIPTSELVRLCGVDGTHLSAEEIADWIKDSDKNGTGEASIEDVHRGITEGSAAFALVKRALFGEEKEPFSCFCSGLLLVWNGAMTTYQRSSGAELQNCWNGCYAAAFLKFVRSTKLQSAAFMISSTGCTMNMILGWIARRGVWYSDLHVVFLESFWVENHCARFAKPRTRRASYGLCQRLSSFLRLLLYPWYYISMSGRPSKVHASTR